MARDELLHRLECGAQPLDLQCRDCRAEAAAVAAAVYEKPELARDETDRFVAAPRWLETFFVAQLVMCATVLAVIAVLTPGRRVRHVRY